MSNQDQSTQQQDEASPREVVSETVFVKPRKPKRKFLIGLGVLIVIFVLALFFVVQTQVGSRFFLNSVERLSGGRVAFGEVNGRLADQLRIDEVAYQDAQQKIRISGLNVEWKAWTLLLGRVDITSVSISTLRIASVPSKNELTMPLSLRLPARIVIRQAAIGRLVLTELGADGQEVKPLELKAIIGSLDSSDLVHQLTAQVDSAWGGLHLKGQVQTNTPFQVQGEFTYRGQPNQDLPKVLIQGNLSGSLQDLRMQAQSVAKTKDGVIANPEQQASADMQLHLAPFSGTPLRSARLKIIDLNPQWINQHAPSAMLDIDLDLQPPKVQVPAKIMPTPVVQTTVLNGEIRIRNRAPQTIDKQGLPLKSFTSALEWQADQLTLRKTVIELLSGTVAVESKLQFRPAQLPLLDASLILKDINLAQIDSRLRQSSIQGNVQLQAKEHHRIDFQAQLREPRASLNADASFLLNAAGDNGLLQLKRFELQAEQASLVGSGEINFEGKQVFKLQAKMTQFNPAHWWLAPQGKLDGEVNVQGSLAAKAIVKLQLPGVSGELSGQKFSASGRVDWQQSTSVMFEQLEMQWGANTLSANGAIGNSQSQLQLHLRADELVLFESLTGFSLTGVARADAVVSGSLDALSATVKLHAEDLRSASGFALAQLDGDLQLGTNPQDPLKLQLIAKDIKSAGISLQAEQKNTQGLTLEKRRNLLEQLQISVNGSLRQHTIEARAQFDQGQGRLLSMQAQGGMLAEVNNSSKRSSKASIQENLDVANTWLGQLLQFKLSGFGAQSGSSMPAEDMVLQAAMNLRLSPSKLSLGTAQFAGGFGKLNLDHLEWTPKSLSTKAKWDALPVMAIAHLIKPQDSLHGDIRLGVNWDLQLKDHVRGELQVQRQSGDLYVPDADGTGQPMSLGLSELNAQLQAGGLIAGSGAERVRIQFNGLGSRLGNWRAHVETQIQNQNDKWTFHSDAPMKGELHAAIPELQWLAGQLSADFAVKGALNLDANFGGTFSHPVYRASMDGRNLELAFASEGLLFPNGELRAQLNQDILTIERLRFTNKVNFVPKLEQLQDLNWAGREGEFVAAGEVNWREQTGSIQADWKNFPLLQRKDRWLVVSGQAKIEQLDNAWALIGKLRADAAYFKLPKLPPPSLSGDVLVSKGVKLVDEDVELDGGKKVFKTKLDLQIDMGPRFVFVGRGLDTALTGTIRLRSTDNSPVHASGSIITNGGQYEGYGQQLEIERGILNFQGSPGNPSLNIRALRKGLAVEAGVDVTGTVANPQVRLVSEPNVPDSEKISWLVLGRESEQVGTADASLLLSAAGAIFGGDGSRNIPRELVQGLGFDEFSIGPAESAGSSKLPNQTVAGATSIGASSNDKVVNIGKRLKPGLVLSVERGVSDASGALKLSWQLSKRVRFIGRSGTDNSVDVKYSFSFN